jgi:hypothetical protein
MAYIGIRCALFNARLLADEELAMPYCLSTIRIYLAEMESFIQGYQMYQESALWC